MRILFFLVLGACSSTSGKDSSFSSSISDFNETNSEILASCSETSSLKGTAGEGEACDGATACAPVCCTCTDGSGNPVSGVFVSACASGICQGESEICTPPDGEINSSFCL